jgi:hypothetical protein
MVHWIESLCVGALLVQWAKACIRPLLVLHIEQVRKKKKCDGLHHFGDRARWWVVEESEHDLDVEIDETPEGKLAEQIPVKNWSCFD